MTADDLVLTTDQNWAARSHRELYDAVHQNNDPGRGGELGWHWEQFGAGLNDAAQAIDKAITETEHGWTGVAADAARSAIRLLGRWVSETGQHATELGARIQEQSRIMAAARAAMPEPVEFNWDAATGTLSGPGIASFAASAADVQAANDKARSAHEQAVAVMTEMERQSRAVDATTPHFTAPFNPTTGRVEELRSPRTEGASAGDAGAGTSAYARSGAVGEAEYERSASLPDGDTSAQEVLAASVGMSGGPVPTEPAGQYPSSSPSPGMGGTAAAALAAAAGAGAFAMRGGRGRQSDESDELVRSGLPGEVSPGAAASVDTTPRSAEPLAQRLGAGGAIGGHGGSGGAGGSGGFGGVRGRAKGKQGGDTELRPGASVGAADVAAGQPGGGPKAPGVADTHADGPGAGGFPPGGMARSPGAEDTERKTAYVQSEDLFEVPGDELPPSVIGGRKKDSS